MSSDCWQDIFTVLWRERAGPLSAAPRECNASVARYTSRPCRQLSFVEVLACICHSGCEHSH